MDENQFPPVYQAIIERLDAIREALAERDKRERPAQETARRRERKPQA